MTAQDQPRKPGGKQARLRSRETWPWLAVVGLIIGVVLATGPPWWFKAFGRGGKDRCAVYQIYAEDRGVVRTIVWSAPTTASSQVATLPTIASIAVSGWEYGSAVPASEVSASDSRIWFRLADGAGWVPFASVRAYPTAYDPTDDDPAVVQPAAPRSCELQ